MALDIENQTDTLNGAGVTEDRKLSELYKDNPRINEINSDFFIKNIYNLIKNNYHPKYLDLFKAYFI